MLTTCVLRGLSRGNCCGRVCMKAKRRGVPTGRGPPGHTSVMALMIVPLAQATGA